MGRSIDSLKRMELPAKLVAVNSGVFVLVSLLALFGIDSSGWLSLPSSLAALAARPWTLFTYMFTHFSFFHLLFNMLWLYWLGNFFLTLGTPRRLMVLYIYGGLLGALFYLAANFIGWFGVGTNGLLCGASASVLAIVVAAAWLTPNFKIQLFLFGGVALKWLAVATVALSVMALPGGGNVGGNIAHLGGALAGAVFALAFKSGHDITSFRFLAQKKRRPAKTPSEAPSDEAQLNALLDKVRRSGYGSLNSTERKKLIELSNRL